MMPMKNCKLLVIDDDEDTCANLREILIEFHHEVDRANDGKQALDLFRERSYGVVLLDYLFPGMYGIELFPDMRGLRGDVDGLLATGLAPRETAESALDAGIRRVLSKPVEAPLLMLSIEEACKS